ncbi:MAG: trehalase family glycosidase [Bacteroidota bacterium]|nr:trehalase family glycosidase [Bacteroidota bacterium]
MISFKRTAFSLLFPLVALLSFAETDNNLTKEVRAFIAANWNGTIEVNLRDSGNLIGLPKPYNVPTVSGTNVFKEIYYWDTYFTNVGLLLDHQKEQAQNNVDDILYMVNRFGKMLNGSNVCYLNRSQPPYLSMMVFDVYLANKDKVWLKSAVNTLEKEYAFWMKERLTPCGLNRYSSSASEVEKRWMANLVKERFNEPDLLKGLTDQQLLTLGSHYTAEAESGWDFTPRFENRCEDFCPIDLNCNLYLYEKNFEFFYKQLGKKDKANYWRALADKRKKLINSYFYDKEQKGFYDYDYVHKTHSNVVSAAIFSLLYVNVVNHQKAKLIVDSFNLLDTPFGLRSCEEKAYGRTYQWGCVNGWAPLHYIAAVGLEQYKYIKESNRIKNQYIHLVNENFKKTGNLWEKYNVLDGSVHTTNEYEMPAFLGWTAGVYIYFTEYQR